MPRRRVLERTVTAPATRVLRRRRNIEPLSSSGDVIVMKGAEDFALQLLKGSPPSLNHFRKSNGYLHVSDLIGKCLRKIALTERFSLPMPSTHIHESMALTFAQGTAMHDYIKMRVGQGHPGKLYGIWSCRCGNLRTEPAVLSKVSNKVCKICAGHPTEYHELELFDKDLMVVGSPDITLYLPEYGVYYPIEIKSINHEDWKELARPKPDHVVQVLFYWYLLRKLGYSVPAQVSILYATKGFLFKTPYKEFIVYPEKVIDRLDPYLEEARTLKLAREGEGMPVRTVCASRDCSEAKACHVANVCFQHT